MTIASVSAGSVIARKYSQALEVWSTSEIAGSSGIMHDEGQQQDRRQQEIRHRQQHQRDDRKGVVDGAVAVQRLEQRRDDRQRQIEQEGIGRQQHRVEDARRQDLRDRPAGDQRLAEIAGDEPAEPGEIADGCRPDRGRARSRSCASDSGVASRPRMREATSPGSTSSIQKMMSDTSSSVTTDMSDRRITSLKMVTPAPHQVGRRIERASDDIAQGPQPITCSSDPRS